MLLNRLMWSAYFAYHFRGEARFPFKSPEVIKRAQARRIQSIVSHAYRTVPYYRETMKRLDLTPNEFLTADDLTKLPILERDQLQQDPEYFVSTAQPFKRYLKLRTGGSTGHPRTVYYNSCALFQIVAYARRERSVVNSLVGKSLGHRKTVILSPLSSAYEIHKFVSERILVPTQVSPSLQYLSLLDPPEKNISLMNDFRPDVIHSYGSYLEVLFAYLHEKGISFHRPKVITYSSDHLSDGVRRKIEKRFDISILSLYGANEALPIGFECQNHLGLHLNMDLFPVRIIDGGGKTLPPGESGDLIVSNLINSATVLLNYRLGDIAAILPDLCPCGRLLPLLSFPQGRSDDFVESTSGQLIHPQSVRSIFTDEEDVWQYQVIQQSVTHFNALIVVSEGCNREQLKERIAAKFIDQFGKGITAEITFVDKIARTAAGKLRAVISMHQRTQLGAV